LGTGKQGAVTLVLFSSEAGMQIRHPWIILSLLLIVSSPVRVLCEEKPLWEIGVGLAVLQMPDYRGSDKYRGYLLPYPYLVYRGIS
jgi:outer membrane protein